MQIKTKNVIELLDLQQFITDSGICLSDDESFNIIKKMIPHIPMKNDYVVLNTILVNPEYGEYYTDPIQKQIAITLKELVKNEKDHEILIHWDW